MCGFLVARKLLNKLGEGRLANEEIVEGLDHGNVLVTSDVAVLFKRSLYAVFLRECRNFNGSRILGVVEEESRGDTDSDVCGNLSALTDTVECTQCLLVK